MAAYIQGELFDPADEDFGPDAGFFSEPVYDCVQPPKVETNATKKRNKRRAWYVSQCFKKDGASGPTVA